MELRIIRDAPADGAWNMSVDEALLRSVARGTGTLRFYTWSHPTLSLGYFQRLADRCSHPPSAGLPVVRRSTGGGAIVHDQELTYSITLPTSEFRSASAARQLYNAFHQSAAKMLTQLGLPATLWSVSGTHEMTDEPFLCFQRRADGDVVAEGQKILGSAQRRAKGALLQHGSLLIRTAAAAAEIHGFERWMTGPVHPDELAERWSHTLGMELAVRFRPDDLTVAERAHAQLIQAERFTNRTWTERR